MKNYVSLHNHSTFSLGDGLYFYKDYMVKVQNMGGTAWSMTEHGNLNGVFNFVDAANNSGIKPIIGIEAYHVDDKTSKDKSSHIILLAKNLVGYKTLLKAQYNATINGFYYRPRIDWNDLKEMSGNVICSTACSGGIIAKYLKDKDKLNVNVKRLKDIFGNDFYFEYVALSRTEHYKPIWNEMYDISKQYDIKSLITVD